MLKFEAPVSDACKAIVRGAETDHFMLGTLAEFLATCENLIKKNGPFGRNGKIEEYASDRRQAWAGGLNYAEALKTARDGDMSAVEKSDKLLEEMERLFPAPSSRHEWVDDVTGAFPNVPAYLAGQPLNMRRKRKTENEFAPLAVVVNLASSAMIDVDDVRKRGVAILALVRALAARRPVELWVGCTAGGNQKTDSDSSSVYFKIETAPMDLAHAAHLISHPSISRIFCYEIQRQYFNTSPGIPWQYSRDLDSSTIRKTYPHIVKNAFPHMSEILAIPMIHGKDQAVHDPKAWLTEMVQQYGGHEIE